MKETLGSADELNIDNFFSVQQPEVTEEELSDDVETVDTEESDDAESMDTSDGSPDDDLDEDLDDTDTIEDDTDDVDIDTKALTKKAKNAEKQRAEMQSKYDKLMANSLQQQNQLGQLTQEIQDLKTKTENQETASEVWSGDDENLMTEGQVKKIIEQASKQVNQPPPQIGSDLEAQQMWANAQHDAGDIGDYVQKNPVMSDPELAAMQTVEGRYVQIRNKLLQSEQQKSKAEINKLRKQIKKMKKGRIPQTGAGNRGTPQRQSNTGQLDNIDKFFSNI